MNVNFNIKENVDRIYPEIVKIRRHIHENPELSQHEKETSALVCMVLDEYGISYQRGIAGYGVVARIGHGQKAVGIRADMDALPISENTGLPYASKVEGVMHACGHDMHTAILLGTAMLLKELEPELDANDSAVKFFFQPAEETIGGAKQLIEAGCMENPKVDKVIALHIDPNYKTGTVVLKYGPMNAATQEFEITVNGKSGHGAHPEVGIDAIVMASNIVTSLQTISSRFNAPTTPVIVNIGKFQAGEAANVVAGTAQLKGTMRALEPGIMEANKNNLTRIVDGICSAYGGSADIYWHDDGYPALINKDSVCALVEDVARELYGDEAIAIMPEPSLGADDFAYFAMAADSCYFNIGVTPENEDSYPLHNEHLAPSEDAMKVGIAIEVASVLRML